MSKSLKRVKAALQFAGIDAHPLEMPGETRTAVQAAAAAGCALDQIAKSIIFQETGGGACHLFITAGGNTVDATKATEVAGVALGRADADAVRAQTGFAIGGVSPVGHLTPCPCYMDPRLTAFTTIWAAAGTPRHIFEVTPQQLLDLTGAQLADFTT
jgi:prolyl-tRNA editing enzyme YbaK/EbsC (Cys-tRNA(Pro) deacylase)